MNNQPELIQITILLTAMSIIAITMYSLIIYEIYNGKAPSIVECVVYFLIAIWMTFLLSLIDDALRILSSTLTTV